MKLATAFLLYAATTVQSAPVYYSDRTAFEAAAGGGLSFESFEEEFTSSASVDFTDFTASETEGTNIGFLVQLRNFASGSVSNAFTDGTGALAYTDNGDSIATFFDFSTPITAFGIDVTTSEASTIAVGGSSILDSFNTAVNTPQFWGVIDTDGITQVTFDVSGGPNVGFDSLSYGVAPTKAPSLSPSKSPSKAPSLSPSSSPTGSPSSSPTMEPTKAPSLSPSKAPSKSPSLSPTQAPSGSPSKSPSTSPSSSPTKADIDQDGVFDDEDECLGTTSGDENVPEIKLKPNHFVLGSDGYNFDKGEVKGKGEGTDKSFTIVDTHGCSCEQIIEKLGLGNGHRKFGCSPGVMDCWVNGNCDLFDRNLRG